MSDFEECRIDRQNMNIQNHKNWGYEEEINLLLLVSITEKDWKTISKILNYHFHDSRKIRQAADCKKKWSKIRFLSSDDTEIVQNSSRTLRNNRNKILKESRNNTSVYCKLEECTKERKEFLCNNLSSNKLAEDLRVEISREDQFANLNFVMPMQSFIISDLSQLSCSGSVSGIQKSQDVQVAESILDSFCI